MIKRPMLGILAAFVLGLFSFGNRLIFPLVLISFGVFVFLSYLSSRNILLTVSDFILPAKRKYIGIFLLLCVVMYVTGYFRCFFYSLDTEKSRAPYLLLRNNLETKAVVAGEVSDIILEDGKYRFLLKSCVIKGYEENVEYDAGGCYVYVEEDKVGTSVVKSIGTKTIESEQENEKLLPKDIKPGNQIKVYGNYFLHEEATNPGQFDSYEYNLKKESFAGITAKSWWLLEDDINLVKAFQINVKNKIKAALKYAYDEENAGIIYAMLTGEKSLLSDETKGEYKRAGVSHILAISGLHITLICMGLFRILRQIRCPIKLNFIISISFIVFYCAFTGGSVSAIRAAIMSITLIISYAVRRKYDMLSALSLSAIITLILFPMEYKDAGFVLSYFAMLGVFVSIELKLTVFSGAVITLMTLPVSLWFYYETAMYGIVSNVLILPLTNVLLIGGLASALLGIVFKPLGLLTAGVTSVGLYIVSFITDRINMLPFSYVLTGKPDMWEMVIYYVSFFWLFFSMRKYRKMKEREKRQKKEGMTPTVKQEKSSHFVKRKRLVKSALITGTGAFMTILVTILIPNSHSSLAFLDVGQGDCAVLIKDDECILFDAGSSSVTNVGAYRLSPYLKNMGVSVIDTVTLSHTDEDHYSGVLEILEAMQPFYSDFMYKMDYDGNIGIKRLVLPKVKEKGEAYVKLEKLAKQKRVELSYMEAGDELETEMKDVSIICLWPVSANSSENDTSLSFRAEVSGYTVYFMGDNNQTSELQIVEGKLFEQINTPLAGDEKHGDQLKSEKLIVLKVGHHGSKTSSSELFLHSINPDIAVISCGLGNSYGHPHKVVLDKLQEVESDIRRTDLEGCVIFSLNP